MLLSFFFSLLRNDVLSSWISFGCVVIQVTELQLILSKGIYIYVRCTYQILDQYKE